MSSIQPTTESQTLKADCPAFCPECSADLYYTNTGCICKNKNCSWLCKECMKDE